MLYVEYLSRIVKISTDKVIFAHLLAFLRLFFGKGLVNTLTSYEGKGCDGQKLVFCYIDYLSTFLLPTLPSPPSYQTFARLYLDAQCKGGWKEQEELCG
uniref:Uncharacterized protein n=1 Tax=Panagrolaimus sp. ES5 TaxID=591445 RepID=A0AC34GSF1_9BILA